METWPPDGAGQNVITRREYLKQAAMASCGLAVAGTRGLAQSSIEGHGTLKAHAHKRGLLAGCAVSAADIRDDAFTRVLAEQYSLVVCENAMKFGPIHPKPDTYNFADADAIVGFARQHGIKVRGHNFVWHEQLPAWFAGTVTKDNAEKILTDHINTVAGHYKGKIQSWDVVNEAINISDGQPDGLRKSPWFELLGPGYLDLAYHTARQADRHAKLCYNEYGIEDESEGNAAKRAATLALLRRFKDRGTPIDALGIQSHIHAGTSQIFGKGLRELIDGAQSLGLEVYLTELDVNTDAVKETDQAAMDQIVAGVYRDYLSVALESRAVKAVLTWGLTDAHTWLNGIKSHREKQPNRPQRPLPFDPDYKPAPAFFAMRDAFDKTPHR
jgi:endo-1,4-beta-xylanase